MKIKRSTNTLLQHLYNEISLRAALEAEGAGETKIFKFCYLFIKIEGKFSQVCYYMTRLPTSAGALLQLGNFYIYILTAEFRICVKVT